ncbi:hypothetical protein [Microbacterium sp. A1-JK]|uniref:hypothetical protein n=1 Tax=Microbacterium sp. A1-JK TaxID=3177516 RepID=UPI00388473FB
MGLKRYEVHVDGRHPHTTTLMLSEEDAKRMGVLEEKSSTAENTARKPRNKAATASNKAD